MQRYSIIAVIVLAISTAFVAVAAEPPVKESLPNILQIAPPSEPGTRLTLVGVVQGKDGRPIAGAGLHVYQTDAAGRYTPDKPMDEPHARLSGWLRTSSDGRFEFRTIRPGGYPKALHLGDRDRKIPAHIHIDINASGHAERRLQVVFADDPLLSDPYWVDWVKKLAQPVVEVHLGAEGETATLTIAVD